MFNGPGAFSVLAQYLAVIRLQSILSDAESCLQKGSAEDDEGFSDGRWKTVTALDLRKSVVCQNNISAIVQVPVKHSDGL